MPENPSPTAVDLAAAEVELPEWDRLRVRDYWDAVVAAELGTSMPVIPGPRQERLSVRTDDERPLLRLIPGSGATEARPAERPRRAA